LSIEPFLKLNPVFKDYLWGGEKLKQLYSAAQEIVAEAWLLSVHPDGQSVIAGGTHQGQTLAACLQAAGGNAELPILVKLIDAKKTLSVQVHPDDAYARAHENDSGKNEMWYVLDSEPGAFLYVGFNRDVSKEEIRQRVTDGTIEEVLHKIPTHPGDAVFIPAGTVHAIGAGNLILEIQQSSNATYRLYDYNRRDAQGNLRQLHLEKALDVLNYQAFSASSGTESAQETGVLAKCRYFSVYKYAIQSQFILPIPDGCFASVVCVQGECTLTRSGLQTTLRRGDSLYLPPDGGAVALTGTAEIVSSYAKR